MIFSLFEKILKIRGVGYAFLSPQLEIKNHNDHLAKFISNQSAIKDNSIYNVLPESVGLDDIFSDIIAGKRNYFTLDNLNRDNSGETIYFDLSIYSNPEKELPLCCIFEEVTHSTTQRQQIKQQKYDIYLLKSILNSRGEKLAVVILGESQPMQNLRQLVEKVARISSATVLLNGESGTGKNLVARTIHIAAQNEQAPFVEINCAAIPENLLESELFGYEKGAFTNASSSKPGLLEEANGGTLFLDEIGEMPIKLQAKLLSFLESKRFRRLGSTKEISVNVRLITATNRDMSEMIQARTFREDLYYRLNVVAIPLPPLRSLGKDVIKIAQNFINAFNVEFGKNVSKLSPAAVSKLGAYHWPGNVRELRNVIERAMIFAENDTLESSDLQIGHHTENNPELSFLDKLHLPLEGYPLEDIEKKILLDALSYANGNQSKAAKLLHLSRDTF